MAGYPPDVVRYFVERFGPEEPLRKAHQAALQVPGFSEEIERVELRLGWLSGQWSEPPGMREELLAEQRALVMEALEVPQAFKTASESLTAEKPNEGDRSRGVDLPTALVERAMQLHVHEGLGRAKLQFHEDLLGLGEWGARAVVYSAKAGKPFGLWLDEQDRLHWGEAITPVWPGGAAPGAGAGANAPVPPKLRLPRPVNPHR